MSEPSIYITEHNKKIAKLAIIPKANEYFYPNYLLTAYENYFYRGNIRFTKILAVVPKIIPIKIYIYLFNTVAILF